MALTDHAFKKSLKGQRWYPKRHLHNLECSLAICRFLSIMDSFRRRFHLFLLAFLQNVHKVYRYLFFKHRTLKVCSVLIQECYRLLTLDNDEFLYHSSLCKSCLLHSSRESILRCFLHIHSRALLCLACLPTCWFS